MANKTSSAVGSALQFMPQADKLTVENLQGVQGTTGGGVQGDVGGASTAKSFGDLAVNLAQYMNTREKQFQQEAFDGAKKILARASEEDVQRLNSIEIAQKYGYGTLVDNPYFHAYTDNLIGVHNAQLADTEYNTMYADNPARTPEEEGQRYDAFMEDKMQKYLDDKPSTNSTAYSEGFFEKKHDTFQVMMDARSKQDVANRVAEQQEAVATQLEDLVYKSTNRPVAETLKEAQTIVNGVRLSAWSPEYKYKLLDKFANDLASTGRYKAEDITVLLHGLDVDTDLDGTTHKASEFVSPTTYAPVATEWRSTHTTKEKLNLINKYKNHPDMSVYDTETAKLLASNNPKDWEEAEFRDRNRSAVEREQAKNKQERQTRATKQAQQSQAKAQQEANDILIRANIDLSLLEGNNNATDIYGNTEGVILGADGKQIEKPTIVSVLGQVIQETIADENLDYSERLTKLNRLLNYKGASGFKDTFTGRFYYNLRNIPTSDLDKGIVEGTYLNMFNMYKVNRDNFQATMGSEVTQAFDMISSAQDGSGYSGTNGLAIGIRQWQTIFSRTPEERQQAQNDISNYFAVVRASNANMSPSIDGVFNMGEGAYMSLDYNDAQNAEGLVKALALDNMLMGKPVAVAVEQAGNAIRDHFVFKWGSILPKTLFTTLLPNGTPEQKDKVLQLGNYALNTLATELIADEDEKARYWDTGNGVNNGVIQISSYDPYRGSITMYNTYTQESRTFSRATIWNQMKYLAGDLRDVIEKEMNEHNMVQ